MKFASAFGVLAMFLSAVGVALAQTYSIDWFTTDGGGGTSTGAIYSISGTVGQPDAGLAMNSGTYSLTGGFWSILAVQTPGAPLLSVQAHDHEYGGSVLAVVRDGLHTATEFRFEHDELDGAVGTCHRRRYEQIHHRKSAYREQVLPASQSLSSFELSPGVAALLWKRERRHAHSGARGKG